MAWSAPRTWVAGDVLTAAQLNVDVRDNTGILRANYIDSVSVASTAGTTTSTSYADIPGTSITMSYTKRSADSRIIVTGTLSNWWNSSATVLNTLGVSVNGTDYALATETPPANQRTSVAGSTNAITGIAAGAITVKLRIKVASGTFNLTTDGYGSIVVYESL